MLSGWGLCLWWNKRPFSGSGRHGCCATIEASCRRGGRPHAAAPPTTAADADTVERAGPLPGSCERGWESRSNVGPLSIWTCQRERQKKFVLFLSLQRLLDQILLRGNSWVTSARWGRGRDTACSFLGHTNNGNLAFEQRRANYNVTAGHYLTGTKPVTFFFLLFFFCFIFKVQHLFSWEINQR